MNTLYFLFNTTQYLVSLKEIPWSCLTRILHVLPFKHPTAQRQVMTPQLPLQLQLPQQRKKMRVRLQRVCKYFRMPPVSPFPVPYLIPSHPISSCLILFRLMMSYPILSHHISSIMFVCSKIASQSSTVSLFDFKNTTIQSVVIN